MVFIFEIIVFESDGRIGFFKEIWILLRIRKIVQSERVLFTLQKLKYAYFFGSEIKPIFRAGFL